jgi:hypothetical protein
MLKIGDTVSFHNGDGVVEGRGILDDFIGFSRPGNRYSDSVFCIELRHRVAAATAFQEFARQHPEASRLQNQHLMDEYRSLEEVTFKEQGMNRRLFSQSIGNDIQFGQAIQLRHVASGKCLAASRKETSKTEPENFRVYLTEEPTQYSWFKLSPGESINQDGDHIGNFSSVILAPGKQIPDGLRFGFARPTRFGFA